MTAKDIIARAIYAEEEALQISFGVMPEWDGLDEFDKDHMREVAIAAIEALTAAGYRIIGPREFDRVTIEAVAEVCDVVADEHDALAIDAGSDDLTPIYRRGERAAKEAAARIRSLSEPAP